MIPPVCVRKIIYEKKAKNILLREEVLEYGLTFSNVYVDTPFHDPNWVLLRYEKKQKSFCVDV